MPLGAFKAALMGTAGVSTADVVLLHDTDYSGASVASITSGIDSTYGEYIFKFYNINPATDDIDFGFQVNVAGQSGYNETITSTMFRAHRREDGEADPAVQYIAAGDQAQGTANQILGIYLGNQADAGMSGVLHLFNPASTTYVKHFYSRKVHNDGAAPSYCRDEYVGGYVNVTGAIDDIQFKMSSGNFDGTIKMWGVK